MAQKCKCKRAKKAKPKAKPKITSKSTVTSKLEQGRIQYQFYASTLTAIRSCGHKCDEI
jgi:hypothetical protein